MKKSIIILIGILFICFGCSPSVNSDNNVGLVIEVYKSKQLLLVKNDGHQVKRYKCSLGPAKGKKQFQGDMKTPEGKYTVTSKINSQKTYKSLGISYPNADDIAYAKKHGKSPGGNICIHGFGAYNSVGKISQFIGLNLTEGCVAVSNEEMDELFKIIPVGTKVIIYQ